MKRRIATGVAGLSLELATSCLRARDQKVVAIGARQAFDSNQIRNQSPESPKRASSGDDAFVYEGLGVSRPRCGPRQIRPGSTSEGRLPEGAQGLRARVKIASGTDAGSANQHGTQAKRSKTMVEYGMAPAQALHSATSAAAELMGWRDRVGSIEKEARDTHIVAVSGNPPNNVTELEHVKLVMKEGDIVRNDLR